MKIDLTEYSDNELSLIVFNDEPLYRMRHQRNFIENLSDLYEFTEEQLETLKNDLIEDLNDE